MQGRLAKSSTRSLGRAGVVILVFIGASLHAAAQTPVRESGIHIRLTTDLPKETARSLVTTVDHAMVQFADAWDVPREKLHGWTVDAAVMSRREQFQRLPYWDDSLPDFRFGYASNNRIFVYTQQGDYYTRHLLLHEAVHAFMFEFFGNAGPTWFQEGTAEWLGTHRGQGSAVRVGVIPESRGSYAYWGRFKKIAEARSADRVPSLISVMKYPADLIGDVEAYSFSWAAIRLLSDHDPFRPWLMEAARMRTGSAKLFNRKMVEIASDRWPEWNGRWMLWVDELDYGFDPARHQPAITRDIPRWDGKATSMKVASDRGWQVAPIRLDRGMTVRIEAGGWTTLAHNPGPWLSTPDGVSLRYVRDHRLGALLAAIVPTRPPTAATLPKLEIRMIGSSAEITASESCWLVLKVNDQTGELADNEGEYQITLSRP